LTEGMRNELAPPTLALSADAQDVLQTFADHAERAQIKGGPLEAIQPFASKMAELAARIAGVMTVFNNINASEVSGMDMINATQLMIYYANETLRLTSAAAISREAKQAEDLRIWLSEKWAEPYVSAADVAQNGPGALRETAKARRLLQYLERFGHLQAMPQGAEIRGNRRREAWAVVRA
jgi:hypothetical protein